MTRGRPWRITYRGKTIVAPMVDPPRTRTRRRRVVEWVAWTLFAFLVWWWGRDGA